MEAVSVSVGVDVIVGIGVVLGYGVGPAGVGDSSMGVGEAAD